MFASCVYVKEIRGWNRDHIAGWNS